MADWSPYGSGKDPVLDCIHLVQDRIQWGLHLFEDCSYMLQVVDCSPMVQGNIQWWTAVMWSRIGSSGGLHLFGSG